VPTVKCRCRSLFLAIVTIALLTGCSPAVRSTAFIALPPQPPSHPIRIFQSTQPECPFEEVGLVSSRQRNKLISMDEVLAALREKAREMGGDAVIGLSEANESQGARRTGQAVVVDRDPVLSGTVIRFTDRQCLR
jgi:hypothetical protein